MSAGKSLIAYDGHIDTVGVGNASNRSFNPYDGIKDGEVIGGRGTSNQEGDIVSAVYGAKIMKGLGLLSYKYTVGVCETQNTA